MSYSGQITLKSLSKPRRNPKSAECVRIASNAAAPDARENNGSHLYRTDGVTQIPVVGATIFRMNSGRLDGDELLSIPR